MAVKNGNAWLGLGDSPLPRVLLADMVTEETSAPCSELAGDLGGLRC